MRQWSQLWRFDVDSRRVAGRQVYTSSIWLRGAVGGEVVQFGLDDGMMHAVTLTTSWQRYSYTFPAYVTDGEQTRGFQLLSTAQISPTTPGRADRGKLNDGPICGYLWRDICQWDGA